MNTDTKSMALADSSYSLGTKGDILVTYDNATSFYHHGHAAIVRYNDDYIVEAIDENVKYSFNKWKKYSTYRGLWVSKAEDADYSGAKSYAEAQLGEPYSILAGKDQSSSWYCSLLAYKAWKSRGFTLDDDGGIYVTPHDLVQDGQTIVYASKG